jgi:hypothetical protein
MVDSQTGEVTCDLCERLTAPSVAEAEAKDWLIDVGVEPNRHFCPECRRQRERP